MKTPEYSPHRENKIEKIELRDNETAFFDGRQFQKGLNPEYGYPYAKADTIIVGKNGPKLEAFGGDCRVVSLFEHGQKIGAIIHIDAIDLYSERHQELIDALVQALGELPPNSEVHLFGDIDSSDPHIQTLKESRIEWNRKIVGALKANGLTNIQEFSKGEGKDVRLDTTNGGIRVFDYNYKVIFEKK